MLTRHVLLSRVQAYMSDGNAALGHYDDKKYSLDLVGEFRGLLDQSPYLTEYVPELDRYLREYSQTNLQNLESFVYWSEEKYGYGLKPVVTITHTSIYKQEGVTGEPIIIASKQIYADHYFEASLGLALLVEATDNEATPRFYLMYLNRSRADALRSSFAFLVRGTIARHIRGEMRETMTLLKHSGFRLVRMRKLYKLADQFLAAKQESHHPRSGRPHSDEKLSKYPARVMTGGTMGIRPRTEIDRLGKKRR